MIATVIRGPWPGITADTRRPGEPPTVGYLAERARLGIPSLGAALLYRCPWCGSMPGEACHVQAGGKRLAQPHDSRQQLAEDPS